MADFVARFAEFSGRFTIHSAIDGVFDLFSPLGERAWVPGWNPELIHPPGVSWERGQIFRTPEERGDAIWIVTWLNRAAHRVEYHRVEAQRYVAHVRVNCTAAEEGSTEVAVAYAFIGLSNEGNDDIVAMTAGAYAERMARWERWITEHLARIKS